MVRSLSINGLAYLVNQVISKMILCLLVVNVHKATFKPTLVRIFVEDALQDIIVKIQHLILSSAITLRSALLVRSFPRHVFLERNQVKTK
jgi:hypothetical protein